MLKKSIEIKKILNIPNTSIFVIKEFEILWSFTNI